MEGLRSNATIVQVTALGRWINTLTAFQDLAGISTLSIEFGGDDDGTQYHSIYDASIGIRTLATRISFMNGR